MLLDDAFEHAGNESHAARAQGLQVARREQIRFRRIAAVGVRIGDQIGNCPDPLRPAAFDRIERNPDRILQVQQLADGGNGAGQVPGLRVGDDHGAGSAAAPWYPGAAHQRGAVRIGGQDFVD